MKIKGFTWTKRVECDLAVDMDGDAYDIAEETMDTQEDREARMRQRVLSVISLLRNISTSQMYAANAANRQYNNPSADKEQALLEALHDVGGYVRNAIFVITGDGSK